MGLRFVPRKPVVAGGIRIVPVNTADVVRRLTIAAAGSHKAMRREVARFAKTTILREALLQVPFDTGALASTGKVTIHDTGVRHSRIIVSFGLGPPKMGKAKVDYALIQHENMAYNHSTGRKAKYLTDPGDANAPMVKKVMEGSLHSVTVGAYGTLGTAKTGFFSPGGGPGLSGQAGTTLKS